MVVAGCSHLRQLGNSVLPHGLQRGVNSRTHCLGAFTKPTPAAVLCVMAGEEYRRLSHPSQASGVATGGSPALPLWEGPLLVLLQMVGETLGRGDSEDSQGTLCHSALKALDSCNLACCTRAEFSSKSRSQTSPSGTVKSKPPALSAISFLPRGPFQAFCRVNDCTAVKQSSEGSLLVPEPLDQLPSLLPEGGAPGILVQSEVASGV